MRGVSLPFQPKAFHGSVIPRTGKERPLPVLVSGTSHPAPAQTLQVMPSRNWNMREHRAIWQLVSHQRESKGAEAAAALPGVAPAGPPSPCPPAPATLPPSSLSSLEPESSSAGSSHRTGCSAAASSSLIVVATARARPRSRRGPIAPDPAPRPPHDTAGTGSARHAQAVTWGRGVYCLFF